MKKLALLFSVFWYGVALAASGPPAIPPSVPGYISGQATIASPTQSVLNLKTSGTNSPNYSFTVNDAANTGVLSSVSGGSIFSVASTGVLTFTHTVTATGNIAATEFTVNPGGALPSAGLYSAVANQLSFATASVSAGTIDATQHWRIGGGGTPTIAASACGSTTQGAITSGGNDQAFKLTVGTASVTSCTITFASAFGTAPREATLTPANATAAAIGTTLAYVSALTTAGLTITGSALAGASYYIQVQ